MRYDLRLAFPDTVGFRLTLQNVDSNDITKASYLHAIPTGRGPYYCEPETGVLCYRGLTGRFPAVIHSNNVYGPVLLK